MAGQALQTTSPSTPAKTDTSLTGHDGYSGEANRQFPMRIPEAFKRQIDADDPDDPLLRQVLPIVEETVQAPGYSSDPLAEEGQQTSPGILHKYRGRALLVLTGACAIHCRYCFRRHFPYADANPLQRHWPATLEYLRKDNSISEIIFSGGDPLSLSDLKLRTLVNDLESIEHIKRLRIHTRIPVVQPERITEDFLSLLQHTRFNTVVVLHVNHARELGLPAQEAINNIRERGITLLNQSVLLKGVNDNAVLLAELSETLFENGVLPYYLHLLDPVQGAAHFEVDEDRARQLHRELQAALPGYLVPKLVREVAGLPYKQPVV